MDEEKQHPSSIPVLESKLQIAQSLPQGTWEATHLQNNRKNHLLSRPSPHPWPPSSQSNEPYIPSVSSHGCLPGVLISFTPYPSSPCPSFNWHSGWFSVVSKKPSVTPVGLAWIESPRTSQIPQPSEGPWKITAGGRNSTGLKVGYWPVERKN